MRWSVIIPAYNEEKRLPAYLRDVMAYFDGRGEAYEAIVVDDGSQDGTGSVVEHLRGGASCSAYQAGREPGERLRGSYWHVGSTGNPPVIH